MNLKEKLKALLAEAKELQTKSAEDLSKEEIARIPVLTQEITATKSKIDAQEAAAASLKEAFSASGAGSKGPVDSSVQGSRATRAAGFAAAFKQQVTEQLAHKAMVPGQTVTIDYSAPLIAEPKPALSLLSLVTVDTNEAPPSGAYLRQSSRENNASTVAGGELKPTSRYELETVPWEMSTIAHLTQPLRKQWLQDFAQFQSWLSVELAYGLTVALQDLLLEGGVTESGATVAGLETLTGTNAQPFLTDPFRSLRTALGNLETDGLQATGIALNPADWTEIELADDEDRRPLTTALLGQSLTRTLWGVPVVVSPQITRGTAWVGDFKSIVYKRRGPLELTMTEKGVYEQPATDPDGEPTLIDLYSRNLLRARAESRAVFQFLQPAALTKVDIAA